MECLEHSLEGKLFYKKMIGGLLWNISRTFAGGEHKLCYKRVIGGLLWNISRTFVGGEHNLCYKRMIGGLFLISNLPHNPIRHNFCGSQIRVFKVSHLYSFNSHTFPAPILFFPELGVAVGFVNWDLWVLVWIRELEDWGCGLRNRELR